MYFDYDLLWKQCFKRDADFKGRSKRSEFWNFYLINQFI